MSVFTDGLFDDPLTQDSLEPTGAERRSAAIGDAWSSMVGPSLYRWAQLDEARKWGGDAYPEQYSPEDAKAFFEANGVGGHLTPENRTYNRLELSILTQRKQAELRRQYVLERAKGGYVEGGERLLLSLGTSLADPLTIASAFVPVVGEARYAALLESAGSSVLRRAGVRAAVGAAEGGVGAAITEPIIYNAKQAEQADYDLYDSLANIAFGTVFGGGLHAVGGAVGDFRVARAEARQSEAFATLRDHLSRLDEQRRKAATDDILVHGTTPENAAGIHASGRFDANVGERNYDYSVFGPDAVYFTTAKFEKSAGGKLWLGNSWADRMAPYEATVKAKLSPDAKVVTIRTLADAENLASAFVQKNPDLVARYFEEYGHPRTTESDLEVFSRMLFSDDLHMSKGSEVSIEASRRLRESVDAIRVEGGIDKEDLPNSSRGSFDIPQVAVLNPEKLQIVGKVDAATRSQVADPQTREAALKTLVAQDQMGEPRNVEPVFQLDPATRTKPVTETLAELERQAPPVRETPEPLPADLDEPVVTQQMQELDDNLKALEAERTLDGSELPEDLRAEIESADEVVKQSKSYAEAARMAVACAMRSIL